MKYRCSLIITVIQIFQPLSGNSVPSVSTHALPAKVLQLDEARTGDPMDVAGASILASLSNFAQSTAFHPSLAQASEDRLKATVTALLPAIPPPSDVSEGSISDIEAAGQPGKVCADPGVMPTDPQNKKPVAEMAMEDTVMDASSAQGVGECLGSSPPKDPENVICPELIEGNIKGNDVDRDGAAVIASATAIKRQNLKEEFTRKL